MSDSRTMCAAPRTYRSSIVFPDSRSCRNATSTAHPAVIDAQRLPPHVDLESPPARAYHQAMIDWSQCPVVERSPSRVSGAWVFRGTRVPVTALFQNIEDGAQVTEFLEWFPGVTLEQVRLVLEHTARSLEVV